MFLRVVREVAAGLRKKGGSGKGESLVACTIAEDSVSVDTYEAKREDVLEQPLRERVSGDLHVSIPTRVIPVALTAAPVAHGGVTAEATGATAEDVRHGASLFAIEEKIMDMIAKDVATDNAAPESHDMLTSSVGENGEAIRWDRAFRRSRSSMDTFTYRD